MVQNELDEHTLVERAETLSFPASVVEFMQVGGGGAGLLFCVGVEQFTLFTCLGYMHPSSCQGYIRQPSFGFPEPLRTNMQVPHTQTCALPPPSLPQTHTQGYIGQPSFGFPEPLRSRVLKGKATIEGRPGASLAPLNMDSLEYRLKEKYGGRAISKRDVLSAALYPKVGGRGGGAGGKWVAVVQGGSSWEGRWLPLTQGCQGHAQPLTLAAASPPPVFCFTPPGV
jgi:hypothetical protein